MPAPVQFGPPFAKLQSVFCPLLRHIRRKQGEPLRPEGVIQRLGAAGRPSGGPVTHGAWHSVCCFSRRMLAMLIVLTIFAAGLIIELITAARAPFGYEDESGFHFGLEGANHADDSECGNPS